MVWLTALQPNQKAPLHSATKQNTDQICQHVLKRLLHHSPGMRFKAGGFNQPDGNLPSMLQLKDPGWINAQQWAYEKLGKPIRPTCKSKTVKDHLYISPELAEHLLDVEVMNDWFPDHALLAAKFRTVGKPPMLPIWRQPKTIPWNPSDLPQIEANFTTQPMPQNQTATFAMLREEVESAVAESMKNTEACLPDACRGRAKTLEVKWRQEYSTPTKKSRDGEYQPTYHGINIQHARWLRQYRRLVNLSRIDPNKAGRAFVHRFQLWKSILTAPGFPPLKQSRANKV